MQSRKLRSRPASVASSCETTRRDRGANALPFSAPISACGAATTTHRQRHKLSQRRAAHCAAASPIRGSAAPRETGAEKDLPESSERFVPAASTAASPQLMMPDHAVGLHESCPTARRCRIDVLGQQPVAVATAQQASRTASRASSRSAERRQRVDVPERADEERVLGRAEIVLLDVAEHEVAAAAVALDRARRCRRSADRRPRGSRARAAAAGCVERVAVRWRRRRRRAAAFHAARVDHCVDALRLARASAATRSASAEVRRDAREAVAGRPAHDAREGVHALRAAELPDAGVGLVVHATARAPSGSSCAEQRVVAAAREALVEEHVRRREDRRAVDVVLVLLQRRCRRAPGPCRDSRAATDPRARRAARLPSIEYTGWSRPSLALAATMLTMIVQVALHRRVAPSRLSALTTK